MSYSKENMNLNNHINNGLLKVRAQPNASNTTLIEEHDTLKLFLKSIPEKGKANQELIKFFKKQFKLKVGVISGKKGRDKILKMQNIYKDCLILRTKVLINIKFSLRNMEESNERQRKEFIHFWVDYMKSQPDSEWSRQQNLLINSMLKTATQWTREEYMELLATRSS
jgi:uncharacterized protein